MLIAETAMPGDGFPLVNAGFQASDGSALNAEVVFKCLHNTDAQSMTTVFGVDVDTFDFTVAILDFECADGAQGFVAGFWGAP